MEDKPRQFDATTSIRPKGADISAITEIWDQSQKLKTQRKRKNAKTSTVNSTDLQIVTDKIKQMQDEFDIKALITDVTEIRNKRSAKNKKKTT